MFRVFQNLKQGFRSTYAKLHFFKELSIWHYNFVIFSTFRR